MLWRLRGVGVICCNYHHETRGKSESTIMRTAKITATACATIGLTLLTGCSTDVLSSDTKPDQAQSSSAAQQGPEVAPNPATGDGQTARQELDQLPVQTTAELQAAKESHPAYNRKRDFGPTWPDLPSGCDARNTVLARDMTNVVKKSDDCTVVSGTLNDPYTGKTIDFRRGVDTSRAVQIDHKVALAELYESGAYDWTNEQREAYANDPSNLLAVDGPANSGKGARDVAEWLPENQGYKCQYLYDQISIKTKYHLSVDEKEKAALEQNLGTC